MRYETPKMKVTYLRTGNVIVTSLGAGDTVTDTDGKIPEADMSGGMD